LTRALALGLALLAGAAGLEGCRQIGFESRPVAMHRGRVETTSGLEYEDLFLGTGPVARSGDEVTFEYTVWLEDGTRVDSTFDRGVAITVELGTAPLAAWNAGLVGIQPQGRRRLVVPPELAYGSEGVPDLIPANATLIIEVLALEVRGHAGESGETMGTIR
jgi:FKBP-type peptidyl-prolyl cis-trans isomerase